MFSRSADGACSRIPSSLLDVFGDVRSQLSFLTLESFHAHHCDSTVFSRSARRPVSAASLRAADVQVDPALKAYQPVSGVSGNLNSIGSDTLNNLMTLWAEGFRKYYPSVNIQVEGKGSATAPPALIKGTAQLGPMSRAMKKEEEEEFEKAFGYKPTRISVALDCLAVYVHKDNPLKGLTLSG